MDEKLKTPLDTKILTTIEQVEVTVNQWSVSIAKQFEVNPRHYHITLVTEDMAADLKLRGGPVVQIYINWPKVLREQSAKKVLAEAFHLMHIRNIRTPVELELFAHVLDRKNKNRKWYREKFGDESEIIPDLVARNTYKVEVETYRTVKLIDKATGITVIEKGKGDIWDIEQKARVKLSRIMRQKNDEDSERMMTELEAMRERAHAIVVYSEQQTVFDECKRLYTYMEQKL